MTIDSQIDELKRQKAAIEAQSAALESAKAKVNRDLRRRNALALYQSGTLFPVRITVSLADPSDPAGGDVGVTVHPDDTTAFGLITRATLAAMCDAFFPEGRP